MININEMIKTMFLPDQVLQCKYNMHTQDLQDQAATLFSFDPMIIFGEGPETFS